MTPSDGASALVEGVTRDGAALARLLASEGARVRLAGRAPGDVPDAAELDGLCALGVAVEPDAALDVDPGAPDVAYLDVWTPETAPRVAALRARGTRLGSLADELLARVRVPVLGVTGTAGKSTTAALAVAVLEAAGVPVQAASARSGNLWPTGALLERALEARPPAWLVLELTSSHLAFVHRSPHVAVVTSFWADHVELHGSLTAYRAAKERLVAFQARDDWIVVDEDEPAVSAFAGRTPARRASFSRSGAVVRGAYLDGGTVRARWDGVVRDVCPVGSLPVAGRLVGNALAACTAALAAGVDPAALADGLREARLPPYRGGVVGSVAGVPVVDGGMAATPAKAAALLEAFAEGSVVLVAGGLAELGGLTVHDSDEERDLLAAGCAEAVRAARAVVLFGPAAARLAPLLAGTELDRVETLDDAVASARRLAPGAGAVVFAPMFPVPLDERMRFAGLAAGRAGGGIRGTLPGTGFEEER